MIVGVKIKTIDNKIEQDKAQQDLDRKTAKISTLSSGNVCKYEFFNWQRCFTGKKLVRKSCYNKKI